MTEQMRSDELPEALKHRTRWPGLVLAIPLAALIIVSYLGVQTLAHRGRLITVTFDRAADVHPGETKVLYQGAEIGQLVKLSPNKDGRRVDYQLRLISEVPARVLTNDARFWLIGLAPSLTDMSSLKSVVSGVAVGFLPGADGVPLTHFDGLSKEPIILPQDHGRWIVLMAHSPGSIHERSEVIFHGQSVGKVTDVEFVDHGAFRIKAFVFEPFAALIGPRTQFWKASPLHISVSGAGANVDLAPVATLLAGGIEMETESPADADSSSDLQTPPNVSSTNFTLYSSESAAHQDLSGPALRYDFVFSGDTGGLARNSPVSLLSFQIGEVESASLIYDPRSGSPQTRVAALIYPRKLAIGDPSGSSPEQLRAATDEAIQELLRRGYRARLKQIPAFIGSPSVALAVEKGAKGGALDYTGKYPTIPSIDTDASMTDLLAQADQILAKVNRVPIEGIGRDLKHLTQHLSALLSAPTTQDTLTHLQSASTKLDQILIAVQPQMEPMMTKLSRATGQLSGDEGDAQDGGLPEMLRQLTEAARSLHTLTDYLERHPESLLRGKRSDQ